MSTDNMTPDQIETIGLGNVHGTMTVDHNSAAMQLDSQHLEQIIGALTHNLDLIEAQLNDPNRFPKTPKDDADRKALEIKAQLEAVAAQQKQTLNVLNALLDTRSMEALAGRGDPLETLFGIDDAGTKLKGGPKVQGTNGQFNGGPLAATPDQQMDPTLKPSEFSALTNSVFGRFYRIVFLEQQAITKLESPLAQNVIQVTRACNGTP